MREAFIWGLGASMGGAVGLLLFIVALWLLEWLTGKAEKKAEKIQTDIQALKALTTRNELTVDQIKAIEKVADHLEIISRSQRL